MRRKSSDPSLGRGIRCFVIAIGAVLFAAALNAYGDSVCDRKIPSGREYDYIRVIMNQKISMTAKLDQMDRACSLYDMGSDTSDLIAGGASYWASAKQDMKRAIVEVNNENNAAMVKAILGNTDIEKKYISELNAIKSRLDPFERLRLVYALSVKYQGKYMDNRAERSSLPLAPTPGQTLNWASRNGKGGVCRDFASLLAWSINKVAMNDDGKKLFSAEMHTLATHVTVNVTLASDRKDGRSLVFSLDPTNYKEFNPLPMLEMRSQFFDIDNAYADCYNITQCYKRLVGGPKGPSAPAVVSSEDEELSVR